MFINIAIVYYSCQYRYKVHSYFIHTDIYSSDFTWEKLTNIKHGDYIGRYIGHWVSMCHNRVYALYHQQIFDFRCTYIYIPNVKYNFTGKRFKNNSTPK